MRSKNDFLHRLSQLREFSTGQFRILENFWLNRMPEDHAPANMFYCLAYGECVWQKGATVSDIVGKGWIFEYIAEGGVEVEVEGTRRRLEKGELLLCRPGTKLRRSVDQQGFLKKRVIILSGNMADYFCDFSGLAGSPFIKPDDCKRLEGIFDAIKEMAVAGSHYLAADLNVLAFSLITEIARIVKSRKYPAPLTQAIRFIECHLEQRITLVRLSTECRVSINTLNRLFKQHLHVSPIHYLIDRRMEQAKHLIAMDSLSLKEIAHECGYDRESFFSRVFKQKYGVSPLAYRRSLPQGKLAAHFETKKQ